MEKNSKGIEAVKKKQIDVIRQHVDHIEQEANHSHNHRTSEDIKDLVEGLHKDTKGASSGGDKIPASPEEDLRQEMLHLLDQKMQLELGFMKAIEKILTKEQKTKMQLKENPSIVATLKNSLLGYDGGKYEFIMEKIANISVLPTYENPRGKHCSAF